MSDSGTPDVNDNGGQEQAPPPVTDWEAEAKRWQAEAEKEQKLKRKVEDQNKRNSTELEKLRAASLSEQDKAVAAAVQAAKDETRAATLQQVGHRLVDAEVRTAAAGRGVNVDALLEGLDRSRFLGDDLEPDTQAIGAWVEAISPKRDAAGFDIGQGARGNGTGATDPGTDELTRALIAAVGPGRRG